MRPQATMNIGYSEYSIDEVGWDTFGLQAKDESSIFKNSGGIRADKYMPPEVSSPVR